MVKTILRHEVWRTLARGIAVVAMGASLGSIPAMAQDFDGGWEHHFLPGNLVLSRSVYDNKASNVTVGEALPPNCVVANVAAGSCVTAAYSGL